ncbi:RDH7 dehydrogenase, partial [Oreocharis arfaki]|nr:RDH7 dehydrogenase [Oreocharis arfaki]
GYFKTAMVNVENLQQNFLTIWQKLPEEIKASYGEGYLRQFLAMFKVQLKSCSSDLSAVTNCMEHALTSVHPRTRYSAGWDAKLLYLPLSYLPSALSDAL